MKRVIACMMVVVASWAAGPGDGTKACPEPGSINLPEWQGSALAKAVMEEKPGLVEKLLAQGASPDEKDNWGDPPLLTALSPGARWLPNGIGTLEQREAEIAEEKRAQIAIAISLIHHNADVNAQNAGGETAMMRLLRGEYGTGATLKVARLMIAHGANLNLRDDYGNTALLNVGRIEVVKLLVKHGADPTIANCRHESALQYARIGHDVERLRLFESHMNLH